VVVGIGEDEDGRGPLLLRRRPLARDRPLLRPLLAVEARAVLVLARLVQQDGDDLVLHVDALEVVPALLRVGDAVAGEDDVAVDLAARGVADRDEVVARQEDVGLAGAHHRDVVVVAPRPRRHLEVVEEAAPLAGAGEPVLRVVLDEVVARLGEPRLPRVATGALVRGEELLVLLDRLDLDLLDARLERRRQDVLARARTRETRGERGREQQRRAAREQRLRVASRAAHNGILNPSWASTSGPVQCSRTTARRSPRSVSG
jgi:hypothetical protein